jgi:hypothetical protein
MLTRRAQNQLLRHVVLAPYGKFYLMLVSGVTTVFGGYKYHPTSQTPVGYESDMTGAALLITMLFNGALTTLYSKSTLDKFQLGRLHTGFIIITGTACAYMSAASALWLLDEIKGRYANKTALFLTLVVPWTGFVAFMYLAALADTPLGQNLDEGKYTKSLMSLLQSILRSLSLLKTGVDVDLESGDSENAGSLLVFPVTCTPRLRAHRQNLDFYPTNTTLLLNIFTMEKDMEEALADLETQDEPNYSTTAKKHKVGRITLMRRY